MFHRRLLYILFCVVNFVVQICGYWDVLLRCSSGPIESPECREAFRQFFMEDYQWNRFSSQPSKACGEVCESWNKTCDALALNDYEWWGTGGVYTSQEQYDSARTKKTGGTCYSLSQWLNCNCCACDSWRLLRKCAAPQSEYFATPSCKEGAWIDNADGGTLHGDECTVQCKADYTTHHTRPFRCEDGKYTSNDPEVRFTIPNDLAMLPHRLCYPIGSPPQKASGSLKFVDKDVRPEILSGTLQLSHQDFWDVTEFVVYWGNSWGEKLLFNDMSRAVTKLSSPIPGNYSKSLIGLSIPAGAKKLLAVPTNAYGESSMRLATPVIDLYVHSGPQDPDEGHLFTVKRRTVNGPHIDGNITCNRGSAMVVAENSTLGLVARPAGAVPDRSAKVIVVHRVSEVGQTCEVFDASAAQVRLVHVEPQEHIWTEELEQVTPVSAKAGSWQILKVFGGFLSRLDKLWLVPRGLPCNHAERNASGHLVAQFATNNHIVQHWRLRYKAVEVMQVCWQGCMQWSWLSSNSFCLQSIGMLDVQRASGQRDVDMHPLVGRRVLSDTVVDLTDSRLARPLEKMSSLSLSQISMDVARDSSYIVFTIPDERKIYRIDLNKTSFKAQPLRFQDGQCDYLIPPPRGPPPTMVSPTICTDTPVVASKAHFLHPASVRVSPSGAFWYVADSKAHRIRRVNIATGYVETVAGNGQASVLLFSRPLSSDSPFTFLPGGMDGDGGSAVHAHLNQPWDVAILGEDEEIFLIADRMNHRVRQVEHGIITTVAGMSLLQEHNNTEDHVIATQARLLEPTGVDWIPGRRAFIIVEFAGQRIRIVNEKNVIQTLVQDLHQGLISARVLTLGSHLYATFILACDERYIVESCSNKMANCYKGCQTQTTTDEICLSWDDNHKISYPEENLNNNFCRHLPKPDGSGPGLWCYTHSAWGSCKPRGEGDSVSAENKKGHSIAVARIPRDISQYHGPQGYQLLTVSPLRWEDSIEKGGSPGFLTHVAGITAVQGGAYAVDGLTGEVIHMEQQPYQCSLQMPVYYPDSVDSCCACWPGFYVDSSSGSCSECSAGYYCDGRRKRECGASQSTFHEAIAYRCWNATCLPEDASNQNCQILRPGQHSHIGIGVTTYKCGHEEVLPGTICMGIEQNSSSMDCCTCNNGMYATSSSSNKTCENCPEGVACPTTWRLEDPLRLRNGYWADGNASGYKIYKCSRPSQCWFSKYPYLWNASYWRLCKNAESVSWIDCSLGAPFNPSMGGAPGACVDNRDGFRCGNCKPGFFDESGKCKLCEKGVSFLVPTFIYLWTMIKLYVFTNNPAQSTTAASYLMSNLASSLITFMQEYSLLKLISISWPNVFLLDDLMGLIPALKLSIVPIECFLNDNSFSVRFLNSLSLPLKFVVGMLMIWALLYCTASLRKRLPENPPQCCARFGDKVNNKLKAGLTGLRTFEMEKNKVINTLGFFFCAIYVALIRMSLTLFQFEKTWVSSMPGNEDVSADAWEVFDDSSALTTYPDVKLLSEEWRLMLFPGIAGFFFYTISFFAFHVYITYRAPKLFTTDPSFRARRKYFYAKYREDRYWFGLIAMMNALVLNAAIFGLSMIPNRQIFLTQVVFLINTIYVVVLLVESPYKNVLNMRLDVSLKLVMAFILVVSSGNSSTAASREHFWGFFLTCGVFATACLIIGYKVMYAVFLPQRWETYYEDHATALGYLMKALFSRFVQLKAKTAHEIVKTLSPTELADIRSSFAILEKGLILPPPTHDPEELAPAPESSWSLDTLSGKYLRRSPSSSEPKETSGEDQAATCAQQEKKRSTYKLPEYLRAHPFVFYLRLSSSTSSKGSSAGTCSS